MLLHTMANTEENSRPCKPVFCEGLVQYKKLERVSAFLCSISFQVNLLMYVQECTATQHLTFLEKNLLFFKN